MGKGKFRPHVAPKPPKRILIKPSIYNYVAGMTTHANPCTDAATWVVSVNTWHMWPNNDEWQRTRWKTFAKHHLNVPFAVTVHVVKQFLIVVELIVPFVGGVIAKVITEWHQQDVVLIQLGFLPILFQQHLRPAKTMCRHDSGQSQRANTFCNESRNWLQGGVVNFLSFLHLQRLIHLQCFDAVGWVAGRASGL